MKLLRANREVERKFNRSSRADLTDRLTLNENYSKAFLWERFLLFTALLSFRRLQILDVIAFQT